MLYYIIHYVIIILLLFKFHELSELASILNVMLVFTSITVSDGKKIFSIENWFKF